MHSRGGLWPANHEKYIANYMHVLVSTIAIQSIYGHPFKISMHMHINSRCSTPLVQLNTHQLAGSRVEADSLVQNTS